MLPPTEKVGLSAIDLLSGKKLQGGFMGYNRFPVDIPRLVDFYLRGLLDLDTIIADRMPLDPDQRRLRRVAPRRHRRAASSPLAEVSMSHAP